MSLSGVGKQDGMYANFNVMYYGSVGGFGKEECVLDNMTGLIWEGKTSDGLRAGGNIYTNFGDGRPGDVSIYVAAVNAIKLCEYSDWRLPTIYELQSLVNYGLPAPGPVIDVNWFPGTAAGNNGSYLSSLGLVWYPNSTWSASFGNGQMGSIPNSIGYPVRLVRNY